MRGVALGTRGSDVKWRTVFDETKCILIPVKKKWAWQWYSVVARESTDRRPPVWALMFELCITTLGT